MYTFFKPSRRLQAKNTCFLSQRCTVATGYSNHNASSKHIYASTLENCKCDRKHFCKFIKHLYKYEHLCKFRKHICCFRKHFSFLPFSIPSFNPSFCLSFLILSHSPSIYVFLRLILSSSISLSLHSLNSSILPFLHRSILHFILSSVLNSSLSLSTCVTFFPVSVLHSFIPSFSTIFLLHFFKPTCQMLKAYCKNVFQQYLHTCFLNKHKCFLNLHKCFQSYLHQCFVNLHKYFLNLPKCFLNLHKYFQSYWHKCLVNLHKYFVNLHKRFLNLHKCFLNLHKCFVNMYKCS